MPGTRTTFSAGERRTAPAAERNKGPILAVLERVLPKRGRVVEVASGTGQHVVHFARQLPRLTWQPSDPDPAMRISIAAWSAAAGLPNLRPPLDIDVRSADWVVGPADAVVCINMVHIAPWAATLHLMAGASRLLSPRGILFLYGPYRRCGRHTAPSNEDFDAQLRRSDPEWGVRDLEDVVEVAERNGFALEDVVAMPANNFSVVFRRS
jgi:SAM-dependent methyltransferase